MNRDPVISSNLASVGYENDTLEVVFVNEACINILMYTHIFIITLMKE